MSSWPFTSAFHCSFGLNRDAPGYTCTSSSTPAALASRATICTISSRTSPLPPGNWCDARNTVGAASADPTNKAPARLTAIPPAGIPLRLKLLMSRPPELSDSPRSSITHRRADLGGHPQLVLHRHHAVHGHGHPRGAVRLLARRDDAAHAQLGAVGIDREGEGPGCRIGAQGRPDVRLQGEVGQGLVGLVGFAELGLPGELDDLVGALLDAHALGIERQVVALRVLPVDAEVALGDRALRLVAVAYFGGHHLAVVAVQPR